MRVCLSAALLSITLINLCSTPVFATYTLNVVFTVDLRAHELAINSLQSDCAPTASDHCYGGVSRRASYIRQQRANYSNTLVVDVANSWQGTAFASPAVSSPRGSNIAQWMSQSGYDVMGLGASDFFVGPSGLAGFLSSLQGPKLPSIVCSNLDVSNEPLLTNPSVPPIVPWAVHSVGGRSIGFVGVMDLELVAISSPGPNVQVANTAAGAAVAVQSALNDLTAVHPDCNIIVLLSSLSQQPDDFTHVLSAVSDVDIVLFQSSLETDTVEKLQYTPSGPRLLVTVPSFTVGPTLYGGAMTSVLAQFDGNGTLTVSHGTEERWRKRKRDRTRRASS
jgi:2',3'-cyclic-nucleotide 2'-phosphodiesterase (5'-nucleotidase family)